MCNPVSYTHLDVYKRQDVLSEIEFARSPEGVVHSVCTSAASVADSQMLADSLHGEERTRIKLLRETTEKSTVV